MTDSACRKKLSSIRHFQENIGYNQSNLIKFVINFLYFYILTFDTMVKQNYNNLLSSNYAGHTVAALDGKIILLYILSFS